MDQLEFYILGVDSMDYQVFISWRVNPMDYPVFHRVGFKSHAMKIGIMEVFQKQIQICFDF